LPLPPLQASMLSAGLWTPKQLCQLGQISPLFGGDLAEI